MGHGNGVYKRHSLKPKALHNTTGVHFHLKGSTIQKRTKETAFSAWRLGKTASGDRSRKAENTSSARAL